MEGQRTVIEGVAGTPRTLDGSEGRRSGCSKRVSEETNLTGQTTGRRAHRPNPWEAAENTYERHRTSWVVWPNRQHHFRIESWEK